MAADNATREAVMACVRSADELDILLVLARNRDRYWSPASVAADTGLSPSRVAVALETLASRNLLDVRIADQVMYRLDPASARCRRLVERTLDAAWRARDAVVELLAAFPAPETD